MIKQTFLIVGLFFTLTHSKIIFKLPNMKIKNKFIQLNNITFSKLFKNITFFPVDLEAHEIIHYAVGY